MRTPSRRWWRRLRAVGGELLFHAIATTYRLIGHRTAQSVGRRLGALAWRLGGRNQQRTLEHLALAFPELSAAEQRALGRACYLHLGSTVMECLWLARRAPEAIRSLARREGWEHVEAARASGAPLVFFTGHCGNWELLAAAASVWGLPVTVVGRALDEERLNRLLRRLRGRFGIETIERGAPGAGRQLLRALRSRRALAMLIDQDTSVDGAFVPFFGHLAYTPVGAAQIALHQDALALPVFIERGADGRHTIRFHAPLDLPADLTAATALMTRTVEEQVRRVPAQWVWMHRRWRRRPEAAAPQPG